MKLSTVDVKEKTHPTIKMMVFAYTKWLMFRYSGDLRRVNRELARTARHLRGYILFVNLFDRLPSRRQRHMIRKSFDVLYDV